MGKFKSLRVWQEAMNLTIFVYNVTKEGQFSRDFGLKDQIQRAVVAIPSNIAEGDEMKSNKHSNHYFYIAKASAAEVLTQAIIANEIGYIPDETRKHIESKCEFISAMLQKLIVSRSQSL